MKRYVLKPCWWYALGKCIKAIILILLIGSLLTLGMISFPVYAPIFKYGYLILFLPLFSGLYLFAFWRSVSYEITREQIKFKRGVFNLKEDYLEIYRIKDLQSSQSFFMRMFSLMTLRIESSDKSHPIFEFCGIPKSNLADQLSALVKKARSENRVYEVD